MKFLPFFSELRLPGSENREHVSARELMEKLDESLREPLTRYLLDSESLVSTQSREDPFDPGAGEVVPSGMSSDGVWVWPAYWGYFVDKYRIAVPVEFIDHARNRNFEPVALTDDELERIDIELERLFSD